MKLQQQYYKCVDMDSNVPSTPFKRKAASTIHSLASGDEQLKCRIGDEDFIAIEARYHAECRRDEQRKQQNYLKSNLSSTMTNVMLDDPEKTSWQQLLVELDAGFEKKYV